MVKRLWIALLLVFLAAVSAQAQTSTTCGTSPCTVGVSKPFTAAADHQPVDGDTTGYRFYLNGAVAETKLLAARTNVQADGTGTISFAVTGLPKGTHVIFVEAYGDGGVTASTTLTLSVVPGKPKAPVNLRVVTQ